MIGKASSHRVPISAAPRQNARSLLGYDEIGHVQDDMARDTFYFFLMRAMKLTVSFYSRSVE